MVAPGGAFADKRVALVVGNAKYTKINQLENPLNDAPDFAEALRKIGFEVIMRTDADKGNFDRALSEFARKATGSDAALFYYAGHGIQYQKQNYLLPVDIEVEDYNDVEFSAISVGRVMDALSRSQGVKIVVLDSCRDNPLDKQLSARTRGVAGATRGLARLDRTEGMVVAYATSPDQVAQDGTGRNSPFTESLIRRMEEPGIEVTTLFRRVAQDVFEKTGGKQRPEYTTSLLTDYFLNLADSDSLVWGRIRDSSDPAEFREFIKKYPASPFAREAQFRIDLFDRLRRDEEERKRLEQERVAKSNENNLIKQLEEERAALAAERLEFERREAARRREEQEAAQKRDAERLALVSRDEADKLARKQAEDAKREADRLAREQAEAAKRDADRLAAEKREAEKSTMAQREAARKEAERQALEKKAEADRLAREQAEAAKREVERLAAEKREAARIAAMKDEEARKEAQRVADAKREAERVAAAEREAARKEVERVLAEKKADADRLAREQAEAAKREADRLVAEKKAEQERFRVAALQEAETKKQQAEAETRACAADADALRKAGAKDIAALRDAMQGMTCDKVRVEASGRVAKLEDDARKMELVCAAESDKVTVAKTAGAEALTKLGALQKTLACETLRPVVADAIRELNALAPKVAEIDAKAGIVAAQTELKRLGCYVGNVNGNLNNGTKTATARFLTAIRATVRDVKYDNDFLDQLRKQDGVICAPEPAPQMVKRTPSKIDDEEDDEPASRPRNKAVAKPPVKNVHAAPVEKPVTRVERAPPPKVPPPAPVASAAAAKPAAPSVRVPIGVGY